MGFRIRVRIFPHVSSILSRYKFLFALYTTLSRLFPSPIVLKRTSNANYVPLLASPGALFPLPNLPFATISIPVFLSWQKRWTGWDQIW